VVRKIRKTPKELDIEIPLRRKYESKPIVLWESVEVTKDKRSLGTVEAGAHRITMHHIWWQPKGTKAKLSTGGSSYLREPCVCLELSIKQSMPPAQSNDPDDPLVRTQLQLQTVDGKPLRFRGGMGARDRILKTFRSEKPADVEIKWLRTYAKDTGKKFVFSGIAPEPLTP